MILRLITCALLLVAFAGCWEAPYKKKDDEEKKPMQDQAGDQSFQAFLGRLKIAVAKRDVNTLSTMMTSDFGYRWDDAPPGENAFLYWDQHNLWGELAQLLQQKFGPHERYMVAPKQAIDDPTYTGYRVGARAVRGSWKLAYFVPPEPGSGTGPAR